MYIPLRYVSHARAFWVSARAFLRPSKAFLRLPWGFVLEAFWGFPEAFSPAISSRASELAANEFHKNPFAKKKARKETQYERTRSYDWIELAASLISMVSAANLIRETSQNQKDFSRWRLWGFPEASLRLSWGFLRMRWEFGFDVSEKKTFMYLEVRTPMYFYVSLPLDRRGGPRAAAKMIPGYHYQKKWRRRSGYSYVESCRPGTNWW